MVLNFAIEKNTFFGYLISRFGDSIFHGYLIWRFQEKRNKSLIEYQFFNVIVIKYFTETVISLLYVKIMIYGYQYHTLIKYLEKKESQIRQIFNFAGTKFRESDQKSQKSRNLIPAKFNTFNVVFPRINITLHRVTS